MKRLTVAVLAALSLMLCAPASRAADDASVPVQATLDNGMRVIIIQNRLAPVVTTNLLYGVGSYDDTLPGVAHATEHMMFRGTDDLSSDQFANIATRIGAQYDAETTTTFTDYWFTVPASYLDVVLRVEADRMQHAAMREPDWTTERGAIEQEVQAHLSNPVLKALLPVNKLFYGDSAWGRDPVGTIASFERMHAADIASFYRTWYHPNNATLVVVGDIDPQVALASVREWFGPIASATLPAHPALPLGPVPATTLNESVDFPVPISLVAMRIPGTASPDWAAIHVLFAALQSGRSRFADLTLTGKALGAAAIGRGQRDGGIATFASIGLPASDPKTGVDDLRGVIADYAKNGIPDDESLDAKAELLASQAYLAASIPGEASQWADFALLGEVPQQQVDALSQVTPADVNRVFNTYIANGSAVDVMLRADPKSAISSPAAAQASENVKVTTSKDVALPAWTAQYFSAPLRAPRTDDRATVLHFRNGLTVVVRQETGSPTFVVSGQIVTNPDVYEPTGKEGVSELASSLLIFGSQDFDYKAYQAAAEHIAAHIDLGTSFSAQARSEMFDRTIALLASGELHPSFPVDRFALVQADAVKSAAALENRPEEKEALAQLYALYPPGDPHRRHSTSKSLAAVTLRDVQTWYRFAYRPDLTTIAVVGDVTPDQVKASFTKYFGAWRGRGPMPPMNYPPVKQRNKPEKNVTIRSTTTTQASVTLTQTVALKRGDSDVVALQVANTMLSGEGTGSMLFRDVRSAHGYVYSIDSSFDVADTGSTFALTFASDPKNVNPAQSAAAATIERLRRFPPNDGDLAAAKAMLLSTYVVGLDSYSSVAQDLLVSTEEGTDANEVSHFYAQVIATTPQDVMRAMRKWIDPARFARVLVLPSST